MKSIDTDELVELNVTTYDISSSKENLKRAVNFVSDRMKLAKRLCDNLFGSENYKAINVFDMYNHIMSENKIQTIIEMAKEKIKESSSTSHLSSVPDFRGPQGKGDVN